jgi:S-adenosylmethionine decarboxylase
MPDPFEGPEKLLELWFSPSHNQIDGGLRGVPRHVWEEMLDIVRCKVLSVVNGQDMDAYLLRFRSAFFLP